MTPKVLVLGSGGREHALLEALSRSPQAPLLFVAPGNAGCYTLATGVDIKADDVPAVLNFVQAEDINFVVVGPEAPLVAGVVDALVEKGVLVFGPSQAAAQLEASKHYAKQIMAKAVVPTAGFAYCKNAQDAETALSNFTAPYVIKEDGLAAGKGVTIAQTLAEAHEALARAEAKHSPVVIEEFLEGVELSVLAIADGSQAIPLISAQDFKRVGDNDTGENTGGMGAYAPVPFVDDALLATIQATILDPMMKTMQAENAPFKGILYAGLMIGPQGQLKVLEFNCRMGDPETQPILMRLKSDLLEALLSATDNDPAALAHVELSWDRRFALGVVLAAANYPSTPRKGDAIQGLPADQDELMVFHAATQMKDKEIHTHGGRVLCVTALGDTVRQAQVHVYEVVDAIHFDGMQYRRDIGHRAVRK